MLYIVPTRTTLFTVTVSFNLPFPVSSTVCIIIILCSLLHINIMFTYQSLKQQSAIGHFPTNFPYLAEQIQFARPNLLYISNGKTIDNLLQYSCFQGMADQFQIVISSSACDVIFIKVLTNQT